jgi:hypothetical protein
MKNILTKAVLCIAICGGITACKKEIKEEEVINFPIELAFNKLSINNPVRLFTDGKEIMDTKVINDYLGANKNLFTKTNWPIDMGALKFISADTLELPNPSPMSNNILLLSTSAWGRNFFDPVEIDLLINSFTIAKNNNQFVFYSSYPFLEFKDNNLGYILLKHKSPLIIIDPLPAQLNTKRTQRVLSGYGTYNEMDMNYMLYKYNYKTPKNYTIGGTPNEFDESVISSLGVKDTLAVATYSIHYKKM